MLQPEPTNLHEAAKQGNVEKCQELLKGGADANAKDARSITPLGVAVGFNRVDVIKELLQAGADVALTDSRGNIPLHYAAGDASLPYQLSLAFAILGIKLYRVIVTCLGAS